MSTWFSGSRLAINQRSRIAIEGNIIYLARNTKNLADVLKTLEKTQVINLYDLAMIKKGRSNGEKCYKLYETILRKDSADAFKLLVSALQKSGNDSIVSLLWNDNLEPNSSINNNLKYYSKSTSSLFLDSSSKTKKLKTDDAPLSSTALFGISALVLITAVPFLLILYFLI